MLNSSPESKYAEAHQNLNGIPLDQRPIIPVEKRYQEIEKFELFSPSSESEKDQQNNEDKMKRLSPI